MRSDPSTQYGNILNRFLHSTLVDGLLHLIYPHECLICLTELSRSESIICSTCNSELHFTYFEHAKESTSLDKLFWGRVPLEYTYAMLYYEKTNTSKQLLSALKYKKRSDVGMKFGEMIGRKLLTNEQVKSIDALIPVPIHPKKEFIRGYNQSQVIADGISNVLNIPVENNFIRRAVNSKSQTKLGRFNRWDNVTGKFQLSTSCTFKHIALVDDVITTGATLETIIEIIQQKYPEIHISVISLALTK